MKLLQERKTLWKIFSALLCRDLIISFRHPREIWYSVIFFIVVASLFSLTISPFSDFLQQMAPGIIWISALLATLLALDNLFRSDYEDGSLEQLLINVHPTSVMVLAKITGHWITSGLPLILISPFLGLMMHLPSGSYWDLILTLILGTPTMSFIGAIGVALTTGLKRSGVLLTLLVTPLFIPVLIFGTSAVQFATLNLNTSSQLYFLSAMLLLSISCAPLAISSALKVSLN